jgi:hypothetical protein
MLNEELLSRRGELLYALTFKKGKKGKGKGKKGKK